MGYEIDFLPASYHRARFKRRRRVWQRGVCVAFCAMVGLGVLGERLHQARLKTRQAEVQSQAELTLSQLRGTDALRREISRLEAKANLVANLQLRVPAGGVTHTVVDSLPAHVSLIRLEMLYRPVAVRRDDSTVKGKGPEPTFALPELADLSKLCETRRQVEPVVRLEGTAPDDMAIAEFQGNLNHCAAFANVRLLFTDRHEFHGQALRRFEMELRVRQPGQGESAERTAGDSSAGGRR